MEKETSKPVTFRADKEINYKLMSLEKVGKESKSEIIKKSIQLSYNTLITRKINEEVYESLKKIFGKVSVDSLNLSFGILRDFFPEEKNSKNNAFEDLFEERGKQITFYNIRNIRKFENKKGGFSIFLGDFGLEVKNEEKEVEIKFYLTRVIEGDIKKFDPEIYLKLNELAGKEGLKTETNSRGEETQVNIVYETEVPIRNLEKFLKNFEENAKKMERFIKKFSKILEKKDSFKEIKKESSEQDNSTQ